MNRTVIALFALAACTQGKISERELRRQQQTDQANLKRQELESVAGAYRGTLKNDSGYNQTVLLNLDVKDLPKETEDSVDPILVPKLVGGLRFQFGGDDSREYVDAGIDDSDYSPSRKTIVLVVKHQQFDRMILRLEVIGDHTLEGTWTAATVNASGSAHFERSAP